MLDQDKTELEQLREENQFLTEELESANKQIFELMKYKVDFEDSLKTARKRLEEQHIDNQEMIIYDL